MPKNASVKVRTPKGELQWVYITGDGRANKQGKFKYQASVIVDEEVAKPFTDAVDAFWKENKPAGAKKARTCGYRPHTVKSDKVDEDGDPIYVEVPGKVEIFFATGTTWPDGKKKQIRTYNAKARPVSLGDKRVGNGSIGCLAGNMAIYDVSGNQGVNLYLEGVQITKLVEFSDDDGFEADDDADGWDGDEFEGGLPEETSEVEADEPAPTGAKPRL